MRISDWSSDVCSSDLIGDFDKALGQVGALAADHLLQGALADLVADRLGHDRAQALQCQGFITGLMKLQDIADSPLDEEIDIDVFLFRGQVALGLRLEVENALVALEHGLHNRNLEMKARIAVALDHTATLETTTKLPSLSRKR